MSAREFAEWEVVLTTKPEDLRPTVSVEMTEMALRNELGKRF